MMLKVGELYKLVGLCSEDIIEIVRKTPKQFKYVEVYSGDKEEKTLMLDLYGSWVTRSKYQRMWVEKWIH